jgi:hypothetical protein
MSVWNVSQQDTEGAINSTMTECSYDAQGSKEFDIDSFEASLDPKVLQRYQDFGQAFQSKSSREKQHIRKILSATSDALLDSEDETVGAAQC